MFFPKLENESKNNTRDFGARRIQRNAVTYGDGKRKEVQYNNDTQ